MATNSSKLENTLWRGFAASAAWIVLCLGYVIWRAEGLSKFYDMKANEFGDFIAGVSAPIAFGWLIYGFFLQGKQLQLQRTELELQREELGLQRKEVERLANETAAQRKAIEANEMHARRDTFFRLREIINDELSDIAFRLVVGADRIDLRQDLWAAYANGNRNIMFQVASANYADPQLRTNLFMKYPRAKQLSHRFCDLFDQLCTEAEEGGFQFRATIERSVMGDLYIILCEGLKRDVRFKAREYV